MRQTTARIPAARGRRRFLVLPSLPYEVRLVIIFGLVSTGVLAQVFTSQLLVGWVVILAGALPAILKPIKKERTLLGGDANWREVTDVEWGRALTKATAARKYNTGHENLSAIGLGAVIFCALVMIEFYADEDFEAAAVVIADALAIMAPIVVLGSVRIWAPSGLAVKMEPLIGIIKYLEERVEPDLLICPMLELTDVAGDTGGAAVPTDARLMLRFRGAPDEFIGVQVQVSINKVSGTEHPYLYAVVLFKHSFAGAAPDAYRPPKGLLLERSDEEEVAVLVLRQVAKKNSGYATDEPRRREIVDEAVALAGGLLKRGRRRLS